MDWEELAEELSENGVPERRSQVAALIETGHTHAEVKEILGLSSRGEVSRHVSMYREDIENSEWLSENAPRI